MATTPPTATPVAPLPAPIAPPGLRIPKAPRTARAAEAEDVELWMKRWHAGEAVHKKWKDDYRVNNCYAYWRGHQREEALDRRQQRKAQVNLIHPQVRAELPSLYFYRPFARMTASPERADTPGSVLEKKKQLLQDTANFFIRHPDVGYRENTFLALKESRWAFGCVEIGHSADFSDTLRAPRPELQEDEDTPIDGQPVEKPSAVEPPEVPSLSPSPSPAPEEASQETTEEETPEQELARLRAALSGERFYVKFISAENVIVSESDRPILEDNDWIGYWEDYNVEDVKKAPAYRKGARGLKPAVPGKKAGEDSDPGKEFVKSPEADSVEAKKIRLYKLWNLRTKIRYVLAEQHKRFLLKAPFKRCPLKFYRPDLDPYHFFPVPPIYNSLGEQDAHNDAWEYLRKAEKQTQARWTYDKEAVKADDIELFETDDANYIPREGGSTPTPIVPIDHPQYTQLPLQLLGLTERAFTQTSGVSSEARQAQTAGEKTATQAMIQNTATQVVGGFDRTGVAEWLGSIVDEIVLLAIDEMLLEQVVQVNVDRESPMAQPVSTDVAQTWLTIKQETLADAAQGISWHAIIDVESISPVAEQEQLTRLIQMLNFIGNPNQAMLLSKAPLLLARLLQLSGMREAVDTDAIGQALEAVVALTQMTAAAGAGTPGGVAPMPGQPSPRPSVPSPQPVAPPRPPGPPGVTPAGGAPALPHPM